MSALRGTLCFALALACGSLVLPDRVGAQDAPRSRASVETPPRPAGWMGVSVTITRTAEDPVERVVITDVWQDSPAQAAGLRAGDRVVGVNGMEVSAERFRSLTQRLQPGDPMALEVVRDGRSLSVTVVAAERPGAEVLVPQRLQEELNMVRGRLVRILEDTRVEMAPEAVDHVARLRMVAPTIVVERMGADSIITRVILDGDSVVSTVHLRSVDGMGSYAFRTDRGAEGARVPFTVWVKADSVTIPEVEVRALAEAVSRVEVRAPRAEDPPARFPQVRVPLARGLAGGVEEDAPVRPLAPFLAGMNRVAGAEMRPLNPGLAGYFGVERGVLVTSVAEETPAAMGGLMAGDVVVAANGAPVVSVQELREALGRSGPVTALTVVRKGRRLELHLR
ncbi:MAG TPA: PDZ domain-containing protein [Longimicrobiales bacterium]|nr:PDZ domain-containing protein [Longimicrobiales bacterium]